MMLAAATLVLSGCNCFKKMAKNEEQVKLTCTPEVLVLNNGKVAADINVTFPEKYFNKKAVLKVTPVIVFEGGEVTSPTKYLQGSKVDENYAVVDKKTGGKYTQHVEFPYDPRMAECELQLRVEIKCPKGKCKEFTLVNANNGALPTTEEAEKIAAGDAATLRAFGLTIATGLNTLQNDLDYAALMEYEANDYKNVTNVTTKADIVYQINSSAASKKALKTDDIKNVVRVVKDNKDNDRVSQSVYVNGYASPDGPEKFNDKLSAARSESGRKAVEKLMKDAGIEIDAASYGEDWEGFKEAVEASSVEDKNMILQVLSLYESSAEREQAIKNMAAVYGTLKDDVLPQLRRAQIVNSADITGKTDAEMVALVEKGKLADLDNEELLHIAEVATDANFKATVLAYAASKYNDARAYNNLGVVLASAGDNEAALKAFEAAESLGSKSGELNNNLALANLAVGDVNKAKAYAKASEADVKAMVSAAEGDYNAAAQKLAGVNAAIANIMNNDLAAAKKNLAGIKTAEADYLRAVVATKEGDLDTAKAQLNNAVSKDASLKDKAVKDINLKPLFKSGYKF